MLRRRAEPSPLKRLLGAAIVIAFGFPAAVNAGTGGVSITWTAPSDCPTSADVSASVGELLGRPPAVPEGRELEVKARAEQKQAGLWIGSVETRYGSTLGSRAFETESCRAAADATALIVALMIDPNAVAARGPRPVPSTETGPPAPKNGASAPETLTATPAQAGPSARAARPPARFFVGPTAAMDVGTLPGPTAGGGARVGVKLARVSVDVAGLAWASSSATIAGTNPPVGGDFRFFSASVAACPTVEAGRFELGGCGLVELVQVRGRGTGVSVPFENTFSWASVGAGVLARLRVNRHLSIPFRLQALAPLAQPSFILKGIVEEQGKVYSPSRVLGRAEVGIDVDF